MRGALLGHSEDRLGSGLIFTVEYRLSDAGTWSKKSSGIELASEDPTTYTVLGLTNGSQYVFRVRVDVPGYLQCQVLLCG